MDFKWSIFATIMVILSLSFNSVMIIYFACIIFIWLSWALGERLRIMEEFFKLTFKDRCVEFYYWWHNQPGTNTEDGFDDWIEQKDNVDNM